MRCRHAGAVARILLVWLLVLGTLLSSFTLDGAAPGTASDRGAVEARGKDKGTASQNQTTKRDKHKTRAKGKTKGKTKGKRENKNKNKNKKQRGKRAPKALDSARIAKVNADAVAALDCEGLQTVRVGDRTYCTHGEDPEIFGAGDTASGARARLAAASGPTSRALCLDDGKSGPRVQIVYVSKPGHNRLAELLPTFRRLASEMDTIVDQSARKTGSSLRIRFVTNDACQVDIAALSVPASEINSFGQVNSALRRAGYDALNRKYLILGDTNAYCGIATFQRADAANARVHDASTGYARVDVPCWDAGTMIHELSHTLGAVQYSAPHTSRGAHCIDEWDVMCYRDEPYRPNMQILCQDGAQEFRLDCGDDDYFAAEPAPGSYLSSHWNMAGSVYFTAGSGAVCVDAGDEPDDAYWYDYWRVPMPEFQVGGSAARSFCDEPGDTDWIFFRGKRGVTYRVQTSDLGAEVDTRLVLYRGLKEQRWDGMDLVAVNDDRAEGDPASEIAFTAPNDSSYLVGISEAGGRAGLDKTYTIAITESDAPLGEGVVALSRGSAKPKQRVTATMSGTSPESTVTFWWQRFGDARTLGDAVSGADGVASFTFRVPKRAAKGVYHIEGIASDNSVASAALNVKKPGGRDGKAGKKKRKHNKRKHKKRKNKQRQQSPDYRASTNRPAGRLPAIDIMSHPKPARRAP